MRLWLSLASPNHIRSGDLKNNQRGREIKRCREVAIRLIHIKIDPSETETAERIWKTECATLMISQKGCISEKLLRARDRGEFISYFICDGSRR